MRKIGLPDPAMKKRIPVLNLDSQTLEQNLRGHVRVLAGTIGERNVSLPINLKETAEYIKTVWTEQGFRVGSQSYAVKGMDCENLWIEIPGNEKREEVVLIGAHYDSVVGSPGADDNASGVGALLEISKELKGLKCRRSIRFVAFVNEEAPFFMTEAMGSRVYAGELAKKKKRISAMLSLESLGYYTEKPGTQNYPPPLKFFYPDRGDFIAVVGNIPSGGLAGKVARYFKSTANFPLECAIVPRIISGAGWSDHSSFWKHGYPAVMVTDTVPYRNPHYHQGTDTPDTLDYAGYTQVVHGLANVICNLADE